jgi:hypothetical protein
MLLLLLLLLLASEICDKVRNAHSGHGGGHKQNKGGRGPQKKKGLSPPATQGMPQKTPEDHHMGCPENPK